MSAQFAEKDAGLRAALTRLADDWDKGLDIDGAHHMDPTRRLVRDVRALIQPAEAGPRWDCSPDCERAYGGVHHGCTYVLPPATTEAD